MNNHAWSGGGNDRRKNLVDGRDSIAAQQFLEFLADSASLGAPMLNIIHPPAHSPPSKIFAYFLALIILAGFFLARALHGTLAFAFVVNVARVLTSRSFRAFAVALVHGIDNLCVIERKPLAAVGFADGKLIVGISREHRWSRNLIFGKGVGAIMHDGAIVIWYPKRSGVSVQHEIMLVAIYDIFHVYFKVFVPIDSLLFVRES